MTERRFTEPGTPQSAEEPDRTMADDIKRYKTVKCPNHKDLDDAVTKSLQSGWQPFGSPYIMNGTEGFFICQAMTSTIGPLGALQGK